MSKIVAKKVLLNQTALIAGETIFTSQAGGDFVLWIYGELNSTSAGSGSLALNMQWTDDLTSSAPTIGGGYGMGNWTSINKSTYGQPWLAHLAPGGSIVISTAGNAPPAGSFYNLYITVQELSGPQF